MDFCHRILPLHFSLFIVISWIPSSSKVIKLSFVCTHKTQEASPNNLRKTEKVTKIFSLAHTMKNKSKFKTLKNGISQPNRLESRVWSLPSAVWTLESAMWRLESGVWRLESGVWRLESGEPAEPTAYLCFYIWFECFLLFFHPAWFAPL